MNFQQVKKVLNNARLFPKTEEYYMAQSHLQDRLAHLECLVVLGEKSGLTFEELATSINALRININQLKKNIIYEKKFVYKFKNALSSLLMQYTNVDSIENTIYHNKKYVYLRWRSEYVKLVLSRLRNILKNIVIRNENIAKIKLAIQEYRQTNRYNYNLLPIEETTTYEDEDYVVEFQEDCKVRYKKLRRMCNRKLDYSNIYYGCENNPELESQPRRRNLFLITKMRIILDTFKRFREPRRLMNRRHFRPSDLNVEVQDTLREFYNYEIHRAVSSYEYLPEHVPPIDIAHCQMDAHGENNLATVSAGNVTLTEARQESIDRPIIPVKHNWCAASSSDIISSYSAMTDRWLKFQDFSWNIAQDRNSDPIVKLSLPRDIIITKNWDACDVPNTTPFRVHRYWRGDMEIKIQLNSNKFQQGQLQCMFYYEDHLDAVFKPRDNVYVASQNHHVLISAGSSNEATLYIPFKYHLPLLSTKVRHDYSSALHLGTLYIRVLNKLRVGKNGPDTAFGTIFGRFVNSEFTGQIYGSLDTPSPQMDTMLSVAETGLRVLRTLNNADNPPNPVPPRYIVPTASHSWSFGTDASEPLHSLRLSMLGQTGHPDGSTDESSIKSICNRFGLLRIEQWSQQDNIGKIIFECDASPLLKQSSYKKVLDNRKVKNVSLSCYAVPPVGVVSSMYNYWSGSLEFRFDLVCTQFHSGRLIIGYVPGATSATGVSLKTLLAGPHVVFNLQEQNQFSYKIPYIADRPFWQRQYNGNMENHRVIAPSRVYLMVLNPLIPMQSVPDSVDINIYMRGAEDFEVSVPVQPCIGLGYNPTVLYSESEMVHALEGYYPYYSGYSNQIMGETYDVFRYSTTGISIALFDSTYLEKHKISAPWEGYYYACSDENLAPKYKDNDGNMQPIKYAVMWWANVNDHSKGAYMFGCPNGNYAELACISQAKNPGYNVNREDVPWAKYLIMASWGTANNTYSAANVGWIPFKVVKDVTPPPSPKPGPKPKLELSDYDLCQGEELSSDLPINTAKNSVSSKSITYFGEKFDNLHDLCRRYQYYCTITLDLNASSILNQCSYNIPVLPQGLDLDLGRKDNINEFSNRCRDGHIPICLSGFRYYRGSVRLRICFNRQENCTFWIQHRPDRKLDSIMPVKCVSVDFAEGVFNHTYASYLQDCNVNSMIELEIPFYQNSSYGLLQRPKIVATNEGFYYGLGEISLGFITVDDKMAENTKPFRGLCFYSLGDDFQMSSFQGFPSVCFTNDIVRKNKIKFEYDDADPQMGFGWNPFASTIDGVKENIKKEIEVGVKEKVDGVMKTVEEPLQRMREWLANPDPGAMFDFPVVRNLLTNLSHIAANFNLKSIAIAVVSVIVEIGVCATSMFRCLLEAVLKVISYISQRCKIVPDTAAEPSTSGIEQNPPVDEAEEVDDADPNMETHTASATAGLLSLLWLSVCGMFSIKRCMTQSLAKYFSETIFKDIKNTFTSANLIFLFLRNILSVFDDMKHYVLSWICPNYCLLNSLNEESAEIQAWKDEVIYLDDPEVFERERHTTYFRARVNLAFNKGAVFFKNLGALGDTKSAIAISKLYNKIRKLRETLVATGDDPLARKEPFVVWQYGEPGVGKSTITHDFICNMFKSKGQKFNVPLIYTHNSSLKHWDNCHNNPALVVDDMFSIKSGEQFENQLALLFGIVSPAIFIPPQASLNDKGKPYAPEILFVNSNYDFLRFENINEDAINRRRHVLIKTTLNPVKKRDCKHCNENIPLVECEPAWMADYHHLSFYIHENPKDSGASYAGPYTYDQVNNYLCKEYNRVSSKNEEMYSLKVKQTLDLIVSSPLDPTEPYEKTFERYKQLQLQQYREAQTSTLAYKVRDSISTGVEGLKVNIGSLNKKLISMLEWRPFSKNSTPIVDIPDEALANCEALQKYMDKLEEDEIQQVDVQVGLWSRGIDYNYYAWNNRIQSVAPSKSYDQKIAYYFLHLESEKQQQLDKHRMNNFRLENLSKNLSFGASLYDILHSQIDHLCELSDTSSWVHGKLCKHYFLKLQDLDFETNKRKCRISHKGKTFQNSENDFDDGTWNEECPESEYGKICLYKSYWYRHLILCNLFVDHPSWDPNIASSSHAFSLIKPMKYGFMEFDLLKDIKDRIKSHYDVLVSKYPRVFNLNICISFFKKVLQVILSIVGIGGAIYAGGLYLNHRKYASNGITGDCGGYDKMDQFHADVKDFVIQRKKDVCGGIKSICASWSSDKSSPESHGYQNLQKIKPNTTVPVSSVQSDVPQVDVCIKRIIQNTFRISAYSNGRRLECYGLVIRDRQLLLLRHYFEEFNALGNDVVYYGAYSNRIENTNLKDGLAFNMMDCKVLYMQVPHSLGEHGSNFVILQLPLKFPQCKNLTNFIANVSQHNQFLGNSMLVTNKNVIHQNITATQQASRPVLIRGSETNSAIGLSQCYKYNIQGRGLCGSVLLGLNMERPILGMHVAGNELTNIGYAEILTYETFVDLPKIHKEYDSFNLPELDDVDFKSMQFDTLINRHGKAEVSIHQSGTTQYVPSLIHGVFPVQTSPNPLQVNDPRLPPNSSPLRLGVEHMGKPPLDFKLDDLVEAKYDLARVIKQHVHPIRNKVGVLDLQTAVCGDNQIQGFEPLEWSTSPGYPLRFEKDKPNQTGKKWLFDLEETVEGFKLRGLHPKLSKQLQYDDACRKRGIKPFTVFIDCLKDTCIPIEKCYIPGKTRIFSISPVQFTIQFKQYFLDFMASYQKSRIVAEHGIGIDVNSLEWSDVARYLQLKGDKIICGDYKNFGPGLMLEAANQAMDLIIDWYEWHGASSEDQAIRRIMKNEILGAYHLVHNVYYTAPCGIPSGSPITTPLNSLVNSLYLRVAWKYITNLSFVEMDTHTNILTYGDDVCINVSDSMCEVFNTETLSNFFLKYNIVFTDIDKSNKIVPYRSLIAANFLKNSFKPHPYRLGVWLAALDTVSIEGCVNWINKRNNLKQATVENAEQCVMLAHGHGESYYNAIIDALEKELVKHHLTFRYQSWKELDKYRYDMK